MQPSLADVCGLERAPILDPNSYVEEEGSAKEAGFSSGDLSCMETEE